MRIELKQGVRLRPEDVTIVHDEPLAHAPRAKAVANTLQGALDLRPPAEPPRYPWEAANPRVKVSIRFEMDEELHMMLGWLKDRLPNTSISKIIREAAEARARELINQVVSHEKTKSTT